MRRLKLDNNSLGSVLSVLKPFLLIAALIIVPAVLLAFISQPGKSNVAAWDKNGLLNVEDLIHKVVELNKKQQHQAAIDLLMNAIEKHKDDSLLRALLTQTFSLFLEDEVRLGQAEIQAGHKPSSYVRVAGALELMGDNFRAMEVLVNGVSLNPDSSELWMKVGKLEHKANRNLEALDVFKEVIRLDPKSADAYNNAAFVLSVHDNSSEEDLRSAESLANTACKLEPKNPEFIDTLAEVKFLRGNHSQALSLIQEAIKIAPERQQLKDRLHKFSAPKGLKFD